MIKLCLGAGKIPMKGYTNIDIRKTHHIDIVHDISNMKEIYSNNSIDEIMAIDVLEHIGRRKWKRTLQDWVDLLKEGGVLKLRVPDIEKLNLWVSNSNYDYNTFNRYIQLVFGDQDFPENSHLIGFIQKHLVKDLEDMGMRIFTTPWYDGGSNLRITAIKGEAEPLTNTDHLDYKWKENMWSINDL